jgi:hypothetical protein
MTSEPARNVCLEEDTIDPEDIAYAAYQAGLEARLDAAKDIDFGVELAITRQLVNRIERLQKEIDECLPVIRSLLEGVDS